MNQTPPRWDLTNIYASLEDSLFIQDFDQIKVEIEALQLYYTESILPLDGAAKPEELAPVLNTLVDRLNAFMLKTDTMGAYLHGLITTNSFDKVAEQTQSRFEIEILPFNNLKLQVRKWLGSLGQALPQALQLPGTAQAHAFYLLEEAKYAKYSMSEAEEILANELNLSGGSAWTALQGVLTSQKTVAFELDGKMQTLSMPALINLRSHPSADVRERAYLLEQTVWEAMKEPLAACLNGVKGQVITLERKRGRKTSLDTSLEQARIDAETLESMQSAMQESLPTFRRYFKAKARHLGNDKLPWWNLFAPCVRSERRYSFADARELILSNFADFSPELSNFAKTAFDHNWIDAESRPGKRGGAYCMGIDALKESRILCNFDGSLDQVMTLAHELGHGFHNYCAFQASKTQLQTRTPMTLAETASIMNETIIFHALWKSVASPDEELALLEAKLLGDSAIIVDILSRFIFEKEVFARRAKATLSADEISQIMLQAQKDTYGDGLDNAVLNPYAWTWKPHYYRAGLSFYNYPYAFGLLFGTGLYATYQQRGAAFVEDYKDLLASTGEASAADLATRFGIDIRSKDFWSTSLAQSAALIERYETLI
jgi:oligoendopeptidase F